MRVKLLFFVVITLFLSTVHTAAQNNSSVWVVDFVKTKDGQQTNYLKFIEENWMRARLFMKNKGIVLSYQVLSMPSGQQTEWDVLLMTEYKDNAGYERREAVFREYADSRRINTAANKINIREISEIKFSRNFSQPISSKTGRMMLAAQTDNADEAEARIPLEYYLKGHATGDGGLMNKAFHTGAKIEGMRDGNLVSWKLDDYVKSFTGKAADDEASRKRHIESVEVSGKAAIAKLIFDYPNAVIVDYMLLLKIDGEWKIVNKIFQGTPKQTVKKN